jgi:hypothetical protein
MEHQDAFSAGVRATSGSRFVKSVLASCRLMTTTWGEFAVSESWISRPATAQLSGELIRTAEGLNVECGQMIDVVRLSLAKQGLKQWVRKDAVIEESCESTDGAFASRVFQERLHSNLLHGMLTNLEGES